jgi:hypothetical protein
LAAGQLDLPRFPCFDGADNFIFLGFLVFVTPATSSSLLPSFSARRQLEFRRLPGFGHIDKFIFAV